MFRFMITFVLCFMMGKAHKLGTFPKCKAKPGSHGVPPPSTSFILWRPPQPRVLPQYKKYSCINVKEIFPGLEQCILPWPFIFKVLVFKHTCFSSNNELISLLVHPIYLTIDLKYIHWSLDFPWMLNEDNQSPNSMFICLKITSLGLEI
jgi:hypothetical protein